MDCPINSYVVLKSWSVMVIHDMGIAKNTSSYPHVWKPPYDYRNVDPYFTYTMYHKLSLMMIDYHGLSWIIHLSSFIVPISWLLMFFLEIYLLVVRFFFGQGLLSPLSINQGEGQDECLIYLYMYPSVIIAMASWESLKSLG